MSARDHLTLALAEHPCCFTPEDAGKLVDNYAHELAEQIRSRFDGSLLDDIREQDANLIDPAVTK